MLFLPAFFDVEIEFQSDFADFFEKRAVFSPKVRLVCTLVHATFFAKYVELEKKVNVFAWQTHVVCKKITPIFTNNWLYFLNIANIEAK